MTDATISETVTTVPVFPAVESTVGAPLNNVPTEPTAVVDSLPNTEATSPAENTPAAVDEDILGGDGLVEETSVVSETVDGDNVKPEDTKNAPTQEAKTDTTPELPKFEEFTLPEGIALADDVKGEFTKLLGEMEIGKLDHEGIQAQGQKFIDLGTKLVTESLERMKENFIALHQEQKNNWLAEFKADKELGGARTNTTINTVREAIKTYGGTEEQAAALREMTKSTGATNNPNLIRLISNMANTIKRYETEQDVGPKDTRMVSGIKPAPTKTKAYQGMYTKQ